MTRHTYRYKRYGFGSFAWKLVLALWCVTIAVILELQELPNDLWATPLALAVFVGPPIALYRWFESHAARQQQHDGDAALGLIRQPLRNEKRGDDVPLAFDPHYPSASPIGGLVFAVDPGRRLVRMIRSNIVDANGRYFDEVGPVTGEITDVQLRERPGSRRWMWLLPPRKGDGTLRLTVSIRTEDDQHITVPFAFRHGDSAAEGWRRTFEQWMRDDREALDATPRTLSD